MTEVNHKNQEVHSSILNFISKNGFNLLKVELDEGTSAIRPNEKFCIYNYSFSVPNRETKVNLRVSETLLFTYAMVRKSEHDCFEVDKYLRDFENDDRLTNGRCDSESMEVRLDFLKGYLEILFEVLTRPPLIDVLNDKKWIKISFDPDDYI